MDYYARPKHHYKPKSGWINDPNGLVYFDGYYHLFYQHAPNHEIPWKEPMCWGHARTRDFLTWEELPVALVPESSYDCDGCWSGTAAVKDGKLFLAYTGRVKKDPCIPSRQRTCIAYSENGVDFEKDIRNPVIGEIPEILDQNNFRDPAIAKFGDKYYCIMASGAPKRGSAALGAFESTDLVDWKYVGIVKEWENAKFAECPSFIDAKNGKAWLSASVCRQDSHFFNIMYGSFENGIFTEEITGSVDLGPDQYAGQMFCDHLGRVILMTWISGWNYQGFVKDHDIGCMSCPREIFVKDSKICAYPVKEVRHLLKDSDPALERTEDGFVIRRQGRESVVYRGRVEDIAILRDEYVLEVFVNGGEAVYTAVL